MRVFRGQIVSIVNMGQLILPGCWPSALPAGGAWLVVLCGGHPLALMRIVAGEYSAISAPVSGAGLSKLFRRGQPRTMPDHEDRRE